MKLWQRPILFLCLLFSGYCLLAQSVEEDTTRNTPFFKARKFNSKCYMGFDGTVSQFLKTQVALTTGGSLNWLVNHKYVVSAEYRILTTSVNVQNVMDWGEPVGLSSQYAGLGFGYIFFNNKTFSLQPELSGGWADVKYKLGHANYTRSFGEVVPAIYGIYNATKYFRFGVGLTYQAATGCNANGLTDAYLNGLGGMIFLRVGTF